MMRVLFMVAVCLCFLAGCYGVEKEAISAEENVWMQGIEEGRYACLSTGVPFKVTKDTVRKMYVAQSDDPDDKPLFIRTVPLAGNTYLVQYLEEGSGEYILTVLAVAGKGILVFLPLEEEALKATLNKYGMDLRGSRWAGGVITGSLGRLKEAMLEHSRDVMGKEVVEIMLDFMVYGDRIKDEAFREDIERRYGTWSGNI